jgi:hypothetical protein
MADVVEKPIEAKKPPEPETWDKSSKDIVAGAVAWMYQACKDQGHKWNTLTASDPIVADGHRLVVADAARRAIPEADVDVTYTDLLAAMHAYGKEDVGKVRKARVEAAAKAEKTYKDDATAVAREPGDETWRKKQWQPEYVPPAAEPGPVEPFEPIP